MSEYRDTTLQELGKQIRQKREDRGINLKDVHEKTKIRVQFLEGIERGDFGQFPGTVYVRGFIRTYLQFLQMEDLWTEYLPVLSDVSEDRIKEEEPPVVGSCTPPTKGFKQASRFWVFAVLLLAAVGTSWYVWYTWDQNGIPSFTIEAEKQNGTEDNLATANAPGEDENTKSDEDRPAKEEENTAALSDEKETPSAQTEPNLPPSGLNPLPTAAELVGGGVPETPPAPPEKKADRQLVITAGGDCWVRVRLGAKTLFERTMKSGDTASFEVKERIEVTYGRAGSVRTSWNGKDLGNPGKTKGVEKVFYAPDGTTGSVPR